MKDDEMFKSLLLRLLSNGLSEPGEALDRLAMGVGAEEQKSKIWERDGFLSGYISARLLHASDKHFYDVVAAEIEKVKKDYVKKFGAPLGFARGFFSFQKAIER